MTTSRARRPHAVPDAPVATWCSVWLVVGAWTAYEMWQLSRLSETVAVTGRPLDEAGATLESLGLLPVVGASSADLGAQVRANAAQVERGSRQPGISVRRLSVLLGFAVALVPTVPVLVAQNVLRGAHRAGHAPYP